MIVSGQQVLEALEREGFRVDQTFEHATIVVRENRIVLVWMKPVLDDDDLASIFLNSGLTRERLLGLLENPTTRDVHNESHVREKRSS